MKILSALIITLSVISTSALAQQATDENGRPVGAKPSFAVSSLDDVYLKKGETLTSSDIKLEYSLPQGTAVGKIVLFHPRRDEELQTFNLSAETGIVNINTKEMIVNQFSAGLYDSQGKLLKSLTIY